MYKYRHMPTDGPVLWHCQVYADLHAHTYVYIFNTLVHINTKKSLIHTYTNKFSSLIHTHAFNTFAKNTKAHVCCIYNLDTPQFLLLIRSPNGPYLPKKYKSAKVWLKKMFECLGEWYQLTDFTFKIMKINHFENN